MTYHILNGDILKDQFPKQILGETIICRECLVEGNVKGQNLNELFQNRAKFINKSYEASTESYFENVAAEFEKIQKIKQSEINLWFEDDLFCQVNFWFVAHLLQQTNGGNRIYLLRPQKHSQYGFGALDENSLLSIYENKTALPQLDKIASLWIAYQSNDSKKMLQTAEELKPELPFLLPAVEAHIERIPSNRNLGRPTDSLISIMKELNTNDFGKIFKAFSERESIYGFGDLQVKRLIEELNSKN